MKTLFQAIYTKFTTPAAQAFNVDMGGKLYLTEAPQNTDYPYTVYYLISDMYDFQFKENFEEIVLQFNVYDDNTSASNIGGYFENLKTMYDWATLSVTGYSTVYMVREFAFLDRIDDVWQYAVQYRVLLEKS